MWDTSIPESPVLIPRPEGQSTQPVKRRSASQTSPNTNLGRPRARHRAASIDYCRYTPCALPPTAWVSFCCLKSAQSRQNAPHHAESYCHLIATEGAFPGFCGVFVVHARDEKRHHESALSIGFIDGGPNERPPVVRCRSACRSLVASTSRPRGRRPDPAGRIRPGLSDHWASFAATRPLSVR
jgi:hypothetical protein